MRRIGTTLVFLSSGAVFISATAFAPQEPMLNRNNNENFNQNANRNDNGNPNTNRNLNRNDNDNDNGNSNSRNRNYNGGAMERNSDNGNRNGDDRGGLDRGAMDRGGRNNAIQNGNMNGGRGGMMGDRERGRRAATRWQKSTGLVGKMVRNQNNEIGTVTDLVIDPDSGRVMYAVVDFGSWMDGNELYAVPWRALDLTQDDATLTLNRETETLRGAPHFSNTQWPNFTDQTWGQSVHEFYGMRGRGDDDMRGDMRPGMRGGDDERRGGSAPRGDLSNMNDNGTSGSRGGNMNHNGG